MDVLTLSWAGAVAVVASVATLTYGVQRIIAQGRATVSIASLQQDHKLLAERVHATELEIARLESDFKGTITTQIRDLKTDLRHVDQKLDELVKEVVGALASIKKD